LTGKSFCPAAKAAFETIWRNPVRFSLVGGIGGMFIFVGKLFISIATTLGFYIVITNVATYSSVISSPVLPTFLVFIFSYAVAVTFMSVYGMAVDGILMCFCHDEELYKNSGGPKYCPETLKVFFEENLK